MKETNEKRPYPIGNKKEKKVCENMEKNKRI